MPLFVSVDGLLCASLRIPTSPSTCMRPLGPGALPPAGGHCGRGIASKSLCPAGFAARVCLWAAPCPTPALDPVPRMTLLMGLRPFWVGLIATRARSLFLAVSGSLSTARQRGPRSAFGCASSHGRGPNPAYSTLLLCLVLLRLVLLHLVPASTSFCFLRLPVPTSSTSASSTSASSLLLRLLVTRGH